MSEDVKYQVGPMARAVIVQIFVPIASAALQPHHQDRFDEACQTARALLASARDDVAAELRAQGICPFCNDLAHPKGAEACGG